MTDEEDSAITFETFRKFQRKEKKNEKLQELPEDFFKTCVEWINRKQKRFEESNDTALLKEIENVKSIVSDIFERRRKKILLLALHSVRSKKVSKNLLPEEEEFFESTVKDLRELEENLLERVLEGKEPDSSSNEEEKTGGRGDEKEATGESNKEDEGGKEAGKNEEGVEETEEEVKEEDEEEVDEAEKEVKQGDEAPEKEEGLEKTGQEEEGDEEAGEENVETRSLGSSELEEDEGSEEVDVESSDGQKLVRIMEKVERFVATDDNEYGPLEEGDLVTLPKDVADLIIEKDKAEESEI